MTASRPTWVLVATAIASQGCESHLRESPYPPQTPATQTISVSGDSMSTAVSPDKIANTTPSDEQSIVAFESVPDLPKDLAIFDSVFWEPEDTRSLRELIRSDLTLKNARVLEIGTGSGLISMCCLQAGATHVVATDINPKAVRNARFNAGELGHSQRFEVRLVPRRSPHAWTVIRPGERFDLIVSNPPWEDSQPTAMDQFALYDPGFGLLDSLLSGCRERLNPGGRMLVAYGCVTAIRRLQDQAKIHGLCTRLLDDRSLDELPELFLPGMLIEVTIPRQSP
ncbi:MAG: 50S ribosomal protein L11 methyltransferase [Planctomycetota bacterium]